jgi:sugar/nucleoside kinase (ribokinase family)
MPGGGAANTGSALAQIGVPVTVFSKVGDDANGQFILTHLQGYEVNTSGIRVSSQDTTPFTFVGIHPGGERTFVHTPGANKTFCLDDLDRADLFQADFLLYQDLWVLPCLDGEPGAGLLAEAQRHGIVTFLDECWGLGPNRKVWEIMLPHVDYALPSFDDMRVIYPDYSPAEIVAQIHRYGPRTVVVKMGKEGCLVSSNGKLTSVPSYAKEIVDTTGAGDCFDAGFIAGLANGCSDVEAARLGGVAAAACIRHTGGAVGIPSFETLWASIKEEV